MRIIEHKLADLKPYENNPRINDKAIEPVAESIRQFGFKVPIIIDKHNVIVCGHTRYEAAKRLDMDGVPCIVANDLTDSQVKAFRLADNKVSEFAEWNEDLVDIEIADLLNEGVNLEVFGFDDVVALDDNFTDSFELPGAEKPEMCTMSFQLHEKQKDYIMAAIGSIVIDGLDCFGNKNKNGNALYGLVKEWAERRTLS